MQKPKIRMRLDIRKAKEVDELVLGGKVSIIVTGRITELRGPREELITGYSGIGGKKAKEEKYVSPGQITLEVNNFKVQSSSDFEDPEEEID